LTKTIVFFPEGAYGPTNNCVGIGDVLRRRGHRVVFVIEESFAGRLSALGFEERLMRLAPPPAEPEVPGQFWKEFIRDTAPEFRRPTIEQLTTFIAPTWQALIDGARYVEPRLRELLAEVQPDVVVEDNVCAFPAVVTHGVPWVRIASCNPAEMRDPAIPPTFSGYPTGDRSGWAEFRAEYLRTHRAIWEQCNAFVVDAGAPSLPDLEFIHESPWLNLYLYPKEIDYQRAIPLGPSWHRLDSAVRATDGPWELPDRLMDRPGPLIYLSLGSLASADVDLMQRLVGMLGQSRCRVIVSKGPQADLYDLPANMAGAEFLPQPAILPQVDVVITHGGNNTVTEAFRFGKPMVVLPVFWDQYDNAQRIHETGYGVRLDTYRCEARDLMAAIDRLLADRYLGKRLAALRDRLAASPGTLRAAKLIEQLATTGQPVIARE
jgi:MGT family glycosyltransferase